MAEAEEVIIDAARHATEAIGGLWRRLDPGRETKGASLLEQKKRLELFLAGLHRTHVPIRTSQPPAPPTALRRLFDRRPRWTYEAAALPATDGRNVFLPAWLDDVEGLPATRLYRILAAQQAGRLLRGTAREAQPLVGLARALYLLAEAAAVDRMLARDFPGLVPDLLAARAAAAAARRESRWTAIEAEVERRYRALLHAPPPRPAPIPVADAPPASARWAVEEAARLARDPGGRFRALVADHFIGAVLAPPPEPTRRSLGPADAQRDERPRSVRLQRSPRARRPGEDEADREPGMAMLNLEQQHEHAEDPRGMQRPIDRDAGEEAEGSADSLSELEEATVVSTPEKAREVFAADDPADAGARLQPAAAGVGVRYPEWDFRAGAYVPGGATVRVLACAPGDEAWAARVIERRRRLFDAVRRRFEGLRPRRVVLRRQVDGDEVDLDAWVEAFADLRGGGSAPERIYALTRPRRRDLAIQLLVGNLPADHTRRKG